MRSAAVAFATVLSMLAVGGCHGGGADASASAVPAKGKPVKPPFAVEGDCKGLLLQWFDAHGVHTAEKRGDIPKGHRKKVRVESLGIAPQDRLDPDLVYVADLSSPAHGKRYAVREVPRHTFDGWVGKATGETKHRARVASATTGNGDVIVYGATWCSACKQAEQFFRQHGVPMVVKDIDTDPQAAAEMQKKAAQAGVSASAIPLIDYKGTVMSGFNPERLEQLMNQSARTL